MRIPPYDAYEPTDLNWLGDLPSHWQASRLGKFFEERREKVSDKDFSALSVTKNGIVPQLENAAKTDAGDNRKKVCVGDFVINSRSDRKGSSGASSLTGSVSLISIVLEPKDINNQFIHHLFRSYSFQEEFYRWGKGIVADLWSTNYSAMKNITIPIPPLIEQQAIASFLNHETARIDTLIKKQQKLIALLKEKRQAVISQAVTKGIDPTAPMKQSGVEWLGEVPEHWTICKIKHVVIEKCGIQMGPFGGMLVDLRATDTGFKIFGQENTISGNFFLGGRWIEEEKYDSLANYHLQNGDIVLTRKGSLGNARLVTDLPQPGIIDSDTIRIRVAPKKAVSSLLTFLLHEARFISEQIAKQKRGAILSGLNSETIANVLLILPPIGEQQSLFEYCKQHTRMFENGVNACNQAISLLQERRTALISAAVTGKIDVRNHPSARAAA